MTAEEFDALPEDRFDDRYRYELLRGVLIVSPPPAAGERSPNDEFGYLLRTYRHNHPHGSSSDDTLPEHTVPCTEIRRHCDRAIWAGLGRQPDELQDVPTVVVEFVSASRRDMLHDFEQKRAEYLAAGVREYWIIDRFRRGMTVHRQTPGGPEARHVRESEAYETELLPGFVLPLARVLGRSDAWPRKRRDRRPKRGDE